VALAGSGYWQGLCRNGERRNDEVMAENSEERITFIAQTKGKIGEDPAGLLGTLLVSRIGLAALSRADITEGDRRDFFVYLDEFQNFTTLSLANMLSELGKYRVGLVLAHQYPLAA
jgi:hypothetical protein